MADRIAEALRLPTETDVAIVGGGPVGLALGCLLAGQGTACVVLERRTTPAAESRAFGIHPPALAVLERAGVTEELIGRGVQITGGRLFLDTKQHGRLPLDSADSAFPFVLAVPQTITEAVLEKRLRRLAPGALVRGADVRHYQERDGGVCLEVYGVHGGKQSLRARWVVACDGKHSRMRESACIPFRGGKYPDNYLMGDFADDTPFGTDAALFVTSTGIVESFPLPEKRRRWVARLPGRIETRDAEDLAAIVYTRTGYTVPVNTCVWMSPFGIEHRLAERFGRGNMLLAGDAAHVVSPIGGQGMNLGLLDAGEIADRLAGQGNRASGAVLSDYEYTRKAAAKVALKRAEWNTRIGRPCPPWHPHRVLVRAIVGIPSLRDHYVGNFTMRGLTGR